LVLINDEEYIRKHSLGAEENLRAGADIELLVTEARPRRSGAST
jgi:hypothetical protein